MIRSYLAALWYRLMHDPDPYDPGCAEAPKSGIDEEAVGCEPRCALAPRVVAGADLDRARRPEAEVNAAFSALLDAAPELASLRDLDHLSAFYVLPEGDR